MHLALKASDEVSVHQLVLRLPKLFDWLFCFQVGAKLPLLLVEESCSSVGGYFKKRFGVAVCHRRFVSVFVAALN